ncbi:MAG TPA: efflux RND transporter permease subunit [Bacteroidales bacterium]|nr:efflux RND transporter permease subunit [Bacteroidales bacterium]
MREPVLKKRNPFFSAFTINVISIVFVIIGISFIRYLPVKLNPGRSLPAIYVSFYYYGATPEIVEKQVTSRLEGVFETIKGVESIISNSGDGWGEIQINLDKETDAQMARFEVLSLIRDVYPNLPSEVTYPVISQSGSDNEKRVQLLTYTLNGNANSHQLFQYLNNEVQPVLSRIGGIQKIETYGSTPYQWEICYKSSLLKELGIDKSDIRLALSNYFNQADLGNAYYYHTPLDSMLIMSVAKGNASDSVVLAEIPVKNVSGRIIYLKDISTISHKQKEEQSFFRINGLTAVNMVVFATAEANQIELAKMVKQKMVEITQKTPGGFSFTLSYDASEYLTSEIQKTFWRTVASIVVLLLFVLLVSRSFRYLLVIVASLFANLAIAVFFYYILKIEIHLYSLAGITVSLGILIDNAIIMTDHIRHKKDKKVFLAVLAATLTTIGALVVIFFLEKEQQINLIDFAWVIMINLSVSLLIALFFVPSVLEKVPLKKKTGKHFFRRKRKILRFNIFYQRYICRALRYKIVFILIGVFAFGLPVFLLPGKMESGTAFSKLYNRTLGSETYQEGVKPVVDKVLGGTLRLFSEYVREENYFASPERTSLVVRVKLPEGASIKHLDNIYRDFENFLSPFAEIDFYQTDIYSFENSRLIIYFKKEFDRGAFPYLLKGKLESKAIDISSADFSIYGVGRGFSNALYSGFKNSRLVFSGYNYDQLIELARQAKSELIKNPRINEVFIESGESWWFTDMQKSYFNIDKNYLAQAKVPVGMVVNEIKNYNLSSDYLMNVAFNREFEEVRLVSDIAESTDLWKLKQLPFNTEKRLKLKDFSSVYKERASKTIYRKNQQYILTVAYDFLGPDELARMVLNDYEKEISQKLPIGYKAEIPKYGNWWNAQEQKQYLLLFVMLAIVYFICAVLLESLVQPLVVMSMIPLSFIGIFLTFYWGGFKFDQGGYASFLLVSGLVVNSALYILNDLNNYQQQGNHINRLKMYVKAYSFKIIPILLTIMSTILGLVPFVFWGSREPFWFALALGTIGGLVFSIPSLVIFLPLMIKNKSVKTKKQNG